MKQKTHAIIILVLAGISLALLFFPDLKTIKRMEWAWGGFSFLFGTLAGYAITTLRERKLRLRKLFSEESSILSSVYLAFKQGMNKEESTMERIRERIDDYCVAVMSHPAKEYEKSGKEYHKLTEILEFTEDRFIYSVHTKLTELLDIRQKINSWSSEGIASYLRLALYIFGMSGVMTLFLIKGGDPLESIIYFLYVTGIFLVLYVIEDIYHLKPSEPESIFSTMENVFDLIERPYFYHEEDLEVVNPPKEYRVFSEGEIHLVEKEG